MYIFYIAETIFRKIMDFLQHHIPFLAKHETKKVIFNQG